MKCSHCKGTGIAQHYQWAEFWRKYRRTVEDAQATMPPAQANALWDQLMEAEGFHNWKDTPEFCECPECDGSGEVPA